jgi:hypothetical protein
MPSYQDLETRMRTVEAKIDFIMRTMILQTVEQLPTLDANGQPMARATRKNLLELYREYTNAELQRLAAKSAWDRRNSGSGDAPPETPSSEGI